MMEKLGDWTLIIPALKMLPHSGHQGGSNCFLRSDATTLTPNGHLLPSLPLCVSESRLSVEPAVKLTWALLKGGLRLSAELLLTLSNSVLFGFIFRACLERAKEKSQETDGKRHPGCTSAWQLKRKSALAWSMPVHADTAAFYHATAPHSCALFFFIWYPGIISHR